MNALVKALSTVSLAALVAMPVAAEQPFEKEIELFLNTIPLAFVALVASGYCQYICA